MPLKDNIEQLGGTYDVALRKFIALEKMFQVNPSLHKQYLTFMKEYEDLGHMTKTNDHNNETDYHLLHHHVVKTESLTTKLRVVFDGSEWPSNGLSLNETQKVGPTLQNDLFSIIVRFRKHSVALTADVEKMYRKVWIHESERHLQQIIWRENQENPINNEDRNPVACDVIKNDFYVDDLLSGAENENLAYDLFNGVSNILASANFTLRKWNSNDLNVLKKISETRKEQEDKVYVCGDLQAKTLGIHWNPREDTFQFNVNLENKKLITKRIALSYISQIFDPLGLVSPVTVLAKVCSEWHNVIKSMHAVNMIRAPRYLVCTDTSSNELHCFSDASEKAYAACIYLKTTEPNSSCNVNLVCAKTKVAPLKSLTIPRLELCGALLLTRLTVKTVSALKLTISRTIYWTDSTIDFSWKRTSPQLLKTFVANRITEIQNASFVENWRHVPTKDNPADIASRGVYENTLEHCKLWWHGPSWLSKEETNWPITNYVKQNTLEMKEVQTCHALETTQDIFARFSTFTKLVRVVVSYILRVKVNCLASKHQKTLGSLTTAELNRTLNMLIKLSQQESFFDDIVQLAKKRQLRTLNMLIKLSQQESFFDDIVQLAKKHAKHTLAKLIFKDAHLKLMHAEPQLLLSHIRENYWPIGGRNLAKQVVGNCATCFKVNPKPLEALVGNNLPNNRLEAKYPFYAAGIDYAGPFLLKEGKRRKRSLFICLTTRAIHLEVVSDLSTETFIMTLRRFTARRGKPAHIY
ncbi:Integrase zinc binding domain [Popillia japonica]|uniref:Integrase zinc binding domain n=1 Tax=Popillia japonica TaxID=7064 RepID=A0AAW1JEY8_POPJA